MEEALRNSRKKQLMTQADMAAAIDSSTVSISKYENDCSCMTLKQLRAWFKAVSPEGKNLILDAIPVFLCK